MVQFIDDHRAGLGVEPICAVLPIAPSTYHRHRHQRTDPPRRSAALLHEYPVGVGSRVVGRLWP